MGASCAELLLQEGHAALLRTSDVRTCAASANDPHAVAPLWLGYPASSSEPAQLRQEDVLRGDERRGGFRQTCARQKQGAIQFVHAEGKGARRIDRI